MAGQVQLDLGLHLDDADGELDQAQPQRVKLGGAPAAILIGCLAALASPCELGLDMGRRS